MNPLPPVTSIRVMALELNYSRSRYRTLRLPLDNGGEIAPKAQRDKQLCHDKQSSDAVLDNLRCGSTLPVCNHHKISAPCPRHHPS